MTEGCPTWPLRSSPLPSNKPDLSQNDDPSFFVGNFVENFVENMGPASWRHLVPSAFVKSLLMLSLTSVLSSLTSALWPLERPNVTLLANRVRFR
jgi:hypothetical protein